MEELNELLTIVIPAKNEEKNLPDCLANLKGFKNVVLVDSSSTDGTRAIFERHPEWDYVNFVWDGHFPKKRNWLLRNYDFKTPWVMFLDADERLTPGFIAEVTAKLKEATNAPLGPNERTDVWVCYYDNWFIDRLLKYGDVMHKTAILRVGAGEYEKIEEDHWSHLDMEIHEHLQVQGRTGIIKSRLEHYDKRSLESYYKKHDAYAAWEANRYRALKGDYKKLTRRQRLKYTLLGSWWFGFFYFCSSYFILRGFMDGRSGFIFALGKMHYFRTIAKLIRTQRKEVPREVELSDDTPINLDVIILIGREKIHLKRCIERLAPLRPRKIHLIESRADDGGVGIAKATAAAHGLELTTVFHAWPGAQSVQFNWALDHLAAEGRGSGWILRLDADEYLTDEGIRWLRANLKTIPNDVDALSLTLERKFLGREIRHATNGIEMTRIFRAGKGRYVESLMDERIAVEGHEMSVPVTFYDDNLNTLAWWKEKHRGYAKREAQQARAGVYPDHRKVFYYKCPPYLRAVLYFVLRYVVQLGFLDGIVGWKWNFWQGLWYRWQVDRELARLK